MLVAHVLIPLVGAMQEPAPAVHGPKEALVELRRGVQQRLPLAVDAQVKQYSDYGSTDVEAGPVYSSTARLTLLADAFLLELDLGQGYKGVHRFSDCELTRYTGGAGRWHYSKWKFSEGECYSWPRYCPSDCQFLWDSFALGGLFAPVVQGSVTVREGKRERVLELTTMTVRGIPVFWRYHFDPETYVIHKVSRRTEDNGRNPVVSEKTGVWTLRYRALQAEDIERVKNWQPPKGSKLRMGKDSLIRAEAGQDTPRTVEWQRRQ